MLPFHVEQEELYGMNDKCITYIKNIRVGKCFETFFELKITLKNQNFKIVFQIIEFLAFFHKSKMKNFDQQVL